MQNSLERGADVTCIRAHTWKVVGLTNVVPSFVITAARRPPPYKMQAETRLLRALDWEATHHVHHAPPPSAAAALERSEDARLEAFEAWRLSRPFVELPCGTRPTAAVRCG